MEGLTLHCKYESCDSDMLRAARRNPVAWRALAVAMRRLSVRSNLRRRVHRPPRSAVRARRLTWTRRTCLTTARTSLPTCFQPVRVCCSAVGNIDGGQVYQVERDWLLNYEAGCKEEGWCLIFVGALHVHQDLGARPASAVIIMLWGTRLRITCWLASTLFLSAIDL